MCAQTADHVTKVENFTTSVYERIVAYKSSHYTFTLPTFLGMILANVKDAALYDQVKIILFQIGFYYQAEDDYWDCFIENGNDITEGKCTWLAVNFLEVASQEQKRLFLESYGGTSTANVGTVKQLYKDVNLPVTFQEFKANSYKKIRNSIHKLPSDVPHSFYYQLLDSIYTLRQPL